DADAAEARLERTSGVPIAVEISLGASVRQSVPHSLLSHPTSSARMNPWMLFPAVDPVAVPERRELVEKEVPATLIVRRIRSEAELVRLAGEVQVRRGVDGAAAAYKSAAPIAREIDRLKAEYEEILVSARDILKTEGARKKADAAETEKAAKRALSLVYRGRWLCARMEERYLSLYELEERLKRSWLEERSDIPEDVREDALVRSRDGFRFEPMIASKDVEIAALDLAASGKPPAEKAVLRRILEKEIETLHVQRNQLLASASLRHVEARIAELKDDDPYIRGLFMEDRIRAKNAICRFEAEARVAATVIQELRLGLEGRWEAEREAILKERALAEERLRIVGLEEKLVETLSEIRWSRSSEESDDAERREEARAKRKELETARAALENEIREALGALEAKEKTAAPPGGK
ncbi:MAG TPA: hypothetical protein VMT52_04005, partial [Planctomycetota bacterium]|nr:hypothetical protein [Planctomycetota bacterium]